ncbi:hypothetical protein EIP91_003935 [Steccherinum ochraceum]|uniref:Heme oxygenase n=1 Tax=Steccherinum ochraceum TaxID=92696 RepID=A0A4R0RR88_9APHY|nr:hypothetical protein EIP91_003935 [Steccherinum ochraceum]
MATSPTLDTTAPIATLLRTSLTDAHDRASTSDGAGWLTRGELDREEYIRYSMMLYHVYNTFERAIEQHATHPVLQPTYNPSLFARASSLAADIAHLLQVPVSSWQSHPAHVELLANPPQVLTDYVSRIQFVATSDPQRLLAHSYVRYLGDLSGGQFIKRALKKSFDLEDGDGVSFYEFKQLGGTGSATIGDMKKIKEWYRDGMNAGVGDDVAVKEAILDEAVIAFDLNSALFANLRAPSRPTASASPAPPLLGDPATPPEAHKSLPVQLQEEEATTGTYRVASVIALVAALSLSHFLLVLGGFTGVPGAAKLEAVQHWCANQFAAAS